MTTIAIKRIAWKELRQQIPFFVALLAFASMLQLGLASFVGANSAGFALSSSYLVGIIGIFAALFSAAVGATLYATEKEMGTFQNLQLLPINSWHLVGGKVSLSAALCLLFGLLAIVIGYVSLSIGGIGLNNAEQIPTAALARFAYLAVLFGLLVLEFFVWGWFFSLISSRPLIAAVMGIFAASLAIQFSVRVVNGPIYDAFSIQPYIAASFPRLVIALIVLAIDVVIAGRWLEGGLGTRAVTTGQLGTTSSTASLARIRHRSIFLRLIWQTFRTSWPLMGIYLAVLLGSLTFSFFIAQQYLWIPLLLGLTASCLAGVFVFSNDHVGNSYRFLSHVGERPTLFWCSRITAWSALIIAIHLILCVVGVVLMIYTAWRMLFGSWALLLMPGYFDRVAILDSSGLGMFWIVVHFAYCWVITALVAFAAGQFASATIRSSIFAALTGIVLGLLVIVWCLLMFISASPWWTIASVAMAFLVATWLTVSPWLSDQHWLRRLALPVVVLVITCSITLFATATHRAYEIPDVPFTIAHEPVSPTAVESIAEKYRRAFQSYQLFPIEIYRVSNQDVELMDDLSFGLIERSERRRTVVTQFVARNEAIIPILADAIEFGAENMEVFENAPPMYTGDSRDEDNAVPLAATSRTTVDELLLLTAWTRLEQGQIDETWRLIKLSMLFDHQFGLVYPELAVRPSHYRAQMHLIGRWALLPGQTEAQLIQASEFLQAQDWLLRTNQRQLEAEYNRFQDLIASGRTSSISARNRRATEALLSLALTYFPWERERARRFVDLLANSVRPYVRNSEVAYQYGQHHDGSVYRLPTEIQRKIGAGKLDTWAMTTIWPVRDAWSSFSAFSGILANDRRRVEIDPFFQPQVYAENLRRMTALKLAMASWQAEHSRLPESQDELGERAFNDNFWAVIPGTREYWYTYSKNGLPYPIYRDERGPFVQWRSEFSYIGRRVEVVPAHTPFISNVPIPHQAEIIRGVRLRNVIFPIRGYMVDSPGETPNSLGTHFMRLK